MNAKKDWIGTYSTPKKFQEGGPMAPPAAPAPAGPEAGAAPEAPAAGGDIEAMITEYAQTRDPQLAVAICDMIVEMMAQGQGGGAPAEGGAPPMAKKGMKMKKGPVFKGSCKTKK